jgi:hypothetical protein
MSCFCNRIVPKIHTSRATEASYYFPASKLCRRPHLNAEKNETLPSNAILPLIFRKQSVLKVLKCRASNRDSRSLLPQ